MIRRLAWLDDRFYIIKISDIRVEFRVRSGKGTLDVLKKKRFYLV